MTNGTRFIKKLVVDKKKNLNCNQAVNLMVVPDNVSPNQVKEDQPDGENDNCYSLLISKKPPCIVLNKHPKILMSNYSGTLVICTSFIQNLRLSGI